MKAQKNIIKNNLFKKIFIKICRFVGYEIIDQANFNVPTQDKILSENLNIQGKKSIIVPLGETKITRKVKELTIIFRSCTNVNMLTQNKKRIFDQKKSEYTFRSLISIIKSISHSKKNFENIKFNVVVIDYNSDKKDLDYIKNLLDQSNLKNSLIHLNINDFLNKINPINSKNQKVTENQISNMSNIYRSLEFAKDHCNDLIYFVEDDYLHEIDAISEMIFTYERLSSQLNKELILCPADYPYLYSKVEATNILLGSKKHWRKVDETLCTFLTSKTLLNKYWEKYISMCEFEHYPFEKPLHDIYKYEYCLSPIPSIAFHCTNINSVFGASPNIDWKRLWEENENYKNS